MRGETPQSRTTVEPTSNPVFAYIDSNLISWIADGRCDDFFPLLRRKGIQPVASDKTLEELRAGKPENEIALLSQHGFTFVSAHEALFLDGKVNFYSTPPMESSPASADYVEQFLCEFLRAISGSNSASRPQDSLSKGLQSLVHELRDELLDFADVRLAEVFERSIAALAELVQNLPDLNIPASFQSDLRAYGLTALHVAGIKPPAVVHSIMQRYDGPDAGELQRLVAPLDLRENIKERIQNICFHLIIAGFARDQRVAKDNERKSRQGARSQFNDIHHIAAASTCDLFLTGDRRCARLAYAAYEAISLRTQVVFVHPKSRSAPFSLVGTDFWP